MSRWTRFDNFIMALAGCLLLVALFTAKWPEAVLLVAALAVGWAIRKECAG